MTWEGRVAIKKPGFKEKKRTPKEEKAFQEQLAIDKRNFAIRYRTDLVRDAIFLIYQATHRLQRSGDYFDCSKDPDFDDLKYVHYAESFIEFALEKLEEITDRDLELGVTIEQLVEKDKKESINGRRARNICGKGKKRSKGKTGKN